MKSGSKTVFVGGVLAFFVTMACGTVPTLADDMSVNVALEESVAIEIPEAVELNIQSSNDGTFGQTSFDVLAATNSSAGYTITLTTESTDLTSDTLDQITSTYPTIPALTLIEGGRTAEQFASNASDMNRWGISIDNTTSYNPITLSSTLKETDTPTEATGDTVTINLASKVNYDTPPGAYSTTMNFSIVANVYNPDLAYAYRKYGKTKTSQGYYRMQDMNSDICTSANEHSELQVQDIRDNKIYWILKAKDGKCWMTQNLDLDLETTPTNVAALTSENTDLNTWSGRTNDNKYTAADGYSETGGIITWTPPHGTIDGTSGSFTWTDDQNFIKTVDVGEWFETDVYFTSNNCSNAAGCNYLTGKGKTFYRQIASPTAEDMHYHMGNSYNWIASVATNTLSEFNTSTFNNTSNNPKNSLCPKGWRLPVASSTNSEDDYVTLSSFYPTPNSAQLDRGIMDAPLYFLRGGVARGGTIQYVGGSGSYYTSTSNGANAVNLDFGTSSLQLNRRDQPGWRGREIRCVAR